MCSSALLQRAQGKGCQSVVADIQCWVPEQRGMVVCYLGMGPQSAATQAFIGEVFKGAGIGDRLSCFGLCQAFNLLDRGQAEQHHNDGGKTFVGKWFIQVGVQFRAHIDDDG
mmetsp:Transcript_28406/g.45867  ORF Transcript_28406/g.45867 Transcript_28406/m.45867 type:complete len:112 (+) Transcript_28406:133-468(+)